MTAAATTPEPAPPRPRPAMLLALLVVAVLVGLVVSLASWAFLECVHQIQDGVFDDLPRALGYDGGAPVWWPLPVLALAGWSPRSRSCAFPVAVGTRRPAAWPPA